jgi:hypothetical protein
MLALESRPLARSWDGVVSCDVMQTDVGEVEYHFIFVRRSHACMVSVSQVLLVSLRIMVRFLDVGCFIVVCILLDFICVYLFLMQVT